MLILVRETATEKAVQGCLFLNDTFICYTLENAAKAIPTGGYNIENSRSPKFKRELPLLFSKAVPASRGVRIHAGNSYKDSSACLLVGMGRRQAYRIDACRNNGHDALPQRREARHHRRDAITVALKPAWRLACN